MTSSAYVNLAAAAFPKSELRISHGELGSVRAAHKFLGFLSGRSLNFFHHALSAQLDRFTQARTL